MEAKQAKLEDSNVAGLGSDEHRGTIKDAAASAAEWKGAGEKVGIQIWRIEKFKVKKWPKKKYGLFHTGDSYIVLNTYLEEETKAKRYNVHFWLGRETTQDEAGTAAYKTVELDTLLGDVPVQYREVQDHESSTFLKIFQGTIEYLDGGVDSGFNHVKPEEYEPRLMQFKGKKNIRVTEVPLKHSSLNEGDVFMLDMGTELIQYNGVTSTPWERRKAGEVRANINTRRNGRTKSSFVADQEDHPVFWTALGVDGPTPVAPATKDVDKKPKKTGPNLFQVSDATGSLETKEVSPTASSLDGDDVFILDIGTKLFVWVGNGATRAERGGAMKVASTFLKNSGRPSFTPVVRLTQGRETKSFFKNLN